MNLGHDETTTKRFLNNLNAMITKSIDPNASIATVEAQTSVVPPIL